MYTQLAYSSHQVIKTELYSLLTETGPAKYVLNHSSHSQLMHLNCGKMVSYVVAKWLSQIRTPTIL